jgi:anhydro-N-acetylmuramic acid kinase
LTDRSSEFFVGLMSGTSLDGIDAVLVVFEDGGKSRLLYSHYAPYSNALRERLLALHNPFYDDLGASARIGVELARDYSATVHELLSQANASAAQIKAIGCHGQTVRHRPELGYTLQLGNPALLAELTNISVVADFRSRDIAAGGQGAPLVPAFHAALFGHPQLHRVIVNIGGISNLTDLPPSGEVKGFDCGPGNLLMDAWTMRHIGKAYDANGAWATSGQAIPALLKAWLAHPFFQHKPPKSTGREDFNLAWLESLLSGAEAPQDIQATLLQLTAHSIADAVAMHCERTEEIYLCGGGARNGALVEALRSLLPNCRVGITDDLGINADSLEAFAFAWLARQTLHNLPGNLPGVTGARHACVLGAIYPA